MQSQVLEPVAVTENPPPTRKVVTVHAPTGLAAYDRRSVILTDAEAQQVLCLNTFPPFQITLNLGIERYNPVTTAGLRIFQITGRLIERLPHIKRCTVKADIIPK